MRRIAVDRVRSLDRILNQIGTISHEPMIGLDVVMPGIDIEGYRPAERINPGTDHAYPSA